MAHLHVLYWQQCVTAKNACVFLCSLSITLWWTNSKTWLLMESREEIYESISEESSSLLKAECCII